MQESGGYDGWTVIHRNSNRDFEAFPDIRLLVENAIVSEFPGCRVVFQTFDGHAEDPITIPPEGKDEAEVQSFRERLKGAYDRALGFNRPIPPAADPSDIRDSVATAAQDIQGDWLVIVPMFQLDVSDASPINGCWSVGDIDFLSVEQLTQRFNKRIAPPVRDRLVENDTSFAVTTRAGIPKDLRKTVFLDLRRAAEILAATGAFYGKRHHACGFTLKGYPSFSARNDRFVQQDGTAFCGNWNQHGYLHSFSLDDAWHQSITTSGILSLFSRLTDKTLDPAWRRQIGSAAAMLGRSIMSLDRADAFLLNVIGLETLLTRQGERNGKKLAKRIKGLSGWHLRKANPNYEAEIKSIHDTRCAIVHDSDYSDLSIEMLLRADSYLANGLLNVVSNPTLFPSKDELVRVADSYAEKENWPNDDSIGFKWFGNATLSPDDLALSIW